MAGRDREEEESGGFKVTDRRLFTPDGQLRSEVESNPPEAKAEAVKTEAPREHPAHEPPPGPKANAEPGVARPSESPGPVSFEHLVMSLATTAMYQLGMVKSPQDEGPPVDLVAAKETIDLLDILQQKTMGNLTPEEEALLTGSLYELHMVFVDLSKNAGLVR